PEILIVDEVLAVGDVAFQRKCLGKMGQVSQQGRTILFVSHNLAAVESLCRTGLVLEQGRITLRGSPGEAIEHYLKSAGGPRERKRSHVVDLSTRPSRRPRSRRLLQRLELFTTEDKPLEGSLALGAAFTARVGFRLERPTIGCDVVVRFDDLLGQRIL